MREAEVMTALKERLSSLHGPDTLILPELGLCQSEARVDLAVVNSQFVGWEVKTAKDTLARLPRQEAVYSRVFDRMWLAVDVKHLNGAAALVPGWWGICTIESVGQSYRFERVRAAGRNHEVDLLSLVHLLWRDEVLAELADLGLADGLARSPRRVLWAELAGAAPRLVTAAGLRRRVRGRLMSREGWRSAAPRT